MIEKEKTILYIDDDADDRELLWEAMQLLTGNLKITFAENGLQALELLNQTQKTKTLPCLIVLDLNMPYLDGKQTFERIKADPQLKDIPLVVLSAGENPADKAYFSNEGITYFTKPVNFSVMGSLATHMVNLCG